MRYYIYLSDTKIDMLCAQIPVRLRDKVATELKIDLQVLSTTLSESPSEATRYSKLSVVEKYIEKHVPVGTVDKPAMFFKATMPLRWAVGLDDLTGAGKHIVYFGGETDQTILGLGGSRKHVLGEAPNAQDIMGHVHSSATMLFFIQELMNDGKLNIENYFLGKEPQLPGTVEHTGPSFIAAISKAIEGPAQTMEFLAKRLLEGNVAGKHVLLGSPIYVALAD